MDCNKVGRLILALRKEKEMTQKQLADAINISNKTISKWERGLGCPDVSLLGALSEVLGVNIEKILAGDLNSNEKEVGNMKRIKFYHCSDCGNVIASLGDADISCCGRKLEPMVPKPADEDHHLSVETIENDDYITFSHDMKKEHYINFVAYVTFDRMVFVRLYPEQGGELRIPCLPRGKLYFGCSKHGLWMNEA